MPEHHCIQAERIDDILRDIRELRKSDSELRGIMNGKFDALTDKTDEGLTRIWDAINSLSKDTTSQKATNKLIFKVAAGVGLAASIVATIISSLIPVIFK